MPGPTAAPTERPRRLTREEKRAQTRERLLEAAERVFLRRGLQGSSVEEISAYRGYRRTLDELPESGQTPRERLRWGAEQVTQVAAVPVLTTSFAPRLTGSEQRTGSG